MKRRIFGITLILFSLVIHVDGGYGSTTPTVSASFDSGGTADLVVGVPYEDVSSFPDNFEKAGVIHVLFGQYPGGLSGVGDLYWHQDTPSIPNVPEYDDRFGWALAIGNFNCDAFYDLAVGVPGETVTDHLGVRRSNAGIVHVFYGYTDGLSLDDDQVWQQGLGSIGSNPETFDQFGKTLTAADFNGDNCDDLAVGSPHEDLLEDQAGMVQVIYGSENGLTDEGNTTLRQGYNGLLDSEEFQDLFGSTLAAGDFNGDGFDDLAIGVPMENLGDSSTNRQGVVHIIYGSHNGVTTSGNLILHQDLVYIEDNAENGDFFGAALVSGNFNGDPYDDLAIGVHGEVNDYLINHGAVNVVFGSPVGLLILGSLYIDKAELGHVNDIHAAFGIALASSDINRDGFTDLAIGASSDRYGSYAGGIVYVLYGERRFRSPYDYERIIQGVNDISDYSELGDAFGRSLTMGDFNGDLYGDLAVGVLYEDVGDPEVQNAGAVNVIYGSQGGLTSDGNQFWYQGLQGLQGVAEEGDAFGLSLAAKPFEVEITFLPFVTR
jgi:hypothetical protein